MAEISINATGGVKLYDADDSHYAQIVAGTITSNVDAITLGHEAHRDLLIRYAGMPTIEPENWTVLNADKTSWTIRHWQNKEISLIKYGMLFV